MSRALYRRYPHFFTFANRVLDAASGEQRRAQAVWLDRGRWNFGPLDGGKFSSRSAYAVVTGVYTAQSASADLVRDMACCLGAR